MGVVVRRQLLMAAGVAAVLALGGCKIVSIADQETNVTDAFNATTYAEGIWETKVVPHFTKEARSLPQVVAAIGADFDAAGAQFGSRATAEGAPWNFIVQAKGTVKEKNTTSRAGTLSVQLADGGVVTLQIGPVVKGNSVRDSLPFVSFKEFTNQLEFADVGKALNALALKAVDAALPTIQLGNTVSFVGAFSLNNSAEKILIMPISLNVGG